MARYNTISSTNSVTGGSTITTPASGLLTTLTGSGTVTIPNPVYYTGQNQSFYNSTASAITLSTPSGIFNGPGAGASSTLSLAAGAIVTIASDGTNYVTQGWLGGVAIATSITASSGTLNSVSIGSTTPGTGAFTTLSATSTTTLAGGSASGIFTFSSSQTSNASNNGAVVITGGLGVGGSQYTGGTINGSNGIYVGKNYSGLGAGNALATFYGVDSGVSNTGISITTKGPTSLYDTSSYPLQVWVNGTATASFVGNGYLGLGTTNPSDLFTIDNSSASNTTGITLASSGTTDARIYANGSNLVFNSLRTNPIYWQINSSTQMALSGSGYLGIGTTNPQVPLQINATNTSNTATGGSHLRLENPSGSQTLIGFTFNGTAKGALRVDSSGNVIFDSLGDYYFNYELGGTSFNFRNGATGVFQSISGTTVNFPGALQYGGNTVLSTSNYTSYVTQVSPIQVGGYSYATTSNRNSINTIGSYASYPGGSGAPSTYDYTLEVTGSGRGWRLEMDWIGAPSPYVSALRDCCQNWSSWYTISVAAASDRRRKTNIEPVTDHRQIIFGLNATRYDVVNEDGTLGDVSDQDPDLRVERPKEIGYIAQDAIKVVPEVVKFNPRQDTPNEVGWANAYTVDYERLVPVLTEATKEIYTDMDAVKDMMLAMQAQIAALQAEVAALKGKQ